MPGEMYKRIRTNKSKYSPSQQESRGSTRYALTVERGLPFSTSRVTTLRYVLQVTLNCNNNAFSYIVFNANGPQTPFSSASTNVTATTAHQPKGWDQWTAFYNDYVVISSTLKVTSSGQNSTDPLTGAGILAVALSDTNGAYGSAMDCLEDGKSVWKHFAPNTSQAPTVVKHYFNAKKFFNITDINDNVTRLGANVTSQPSEAAYFFVQFFCNNTAASSTSGPFTWVELEYTVMFTSPKDLGQS